VRKTARQWLPPRRGTAIQPDSRESQPSCAWPSRHRSSRVKEFLACRANYRHVACCKRDRGTDFAGGLCDPKGVLVP
jgi:hypothetical protein